MEKKDLIDTYKTFVNSFTKNKWEYYEKTIKSIVDEVWYLSKVFNIDILDLCTEIWIDISIFTDKQLEYYRNKKVRKIEYNLNIFYNNEISSEKTNKLFTEIIMKYLIYKWDWDNLAFLLYNKIYLMIKNTNIITITNKDIWMEDIINNFMIQIIIWFKKYKERLISWDWHSTKILSYLDRIIRNIANTMISKNKNNHNVYVSDLITWSLDEENSNDSNTFQDILMFDNWENLSENIYNEIYKTYETWSYPLKHIPPIWSSTSTILKQELVENIHHMKYDNWEFLLNLQWFYYFEKVVKSYTLHWKVINSYFDIICFLKKDWYDKKQIFDYLFGNNYVKFLVVWFSWELWWNSYKYEVKDTNINNYFKKYDNEWNFEKYQLIIIDFINYLFDIKKINPMKIANFYKVIRVIERIYIDPFFKDLYEFHNIKLLNLIANKYNDYNIDEIILNWLKYNFIKVKLIHNNLKIKFTHNKKYVNILTKLLYSDFLSVLSRKDINSKLLEYYYISNNYIWNIENIY